MSDYSVYTLSEEHQLLRQAVRELAEDKIAPRAAEIDETGEYPWDVHEELKRNDLLGLHIPEEYGGAGADKIAHCIVVEELARVCASSSLIVAAGKLGTQGLILSGSEELKQTYLPRVASGEIAFSYALSEREAGSDAAAMKTRAVRDGDGWVLNGSKTWITGAAVNSHFTVMASTDPSLGAKGISAFVVHKDDPGFSVGAKERKMGIHGSPTSEIYFESTRIPGDRIIGEEGTGFITALKTLDHTRSMIGAQAVGIAQGALDQSIAYVKERKQFGKAIGEFQGVQFMLADMAMKVEAARHLVYVASAAAERGDANLTLLSSASKTFASDTAMQVTTDAVQLFGGYGYTREYPVEQLYRDNRLNAIHEGTHGIQALDLLGRKVTMDGGAGLTRLAEAIEATCAKAPEPYAGQLREVVARIVEVTQKVWGAGDVALSLANATPYMEAVGHAVIAWMWLEQLIAADGKDGDFYEGKRRAAQYFFAWELPKTGPQLDLVASLDRTTLDMEPRYF